MKTIIVTGASSGLGLWTAKYLLDLDYHVIMACRNIENTKFAISKFTEFNLRKRYSVRQLDLSDFQSIQNFVAELAPTKEIYGLDCNAGITYEGNFRYTKQGIEETFGVNHIGHFYLSHLLLQKFLIQRIVVISSALHDLKNKAPMAKAVYRKVVDMAYPTIDNAKTLAKQTQEFYSTSKLCNVLFTYELARRMNGKAIVNAYNPGLMPTTNFANTGKLSNLIFRKILFVIGSLFGIATTPKKSAKYVVRLLTEETESGSYFDKDKSVGSSKDSYDESKAKELWEGSEELIKSITK